MLLINELQNRIMRPRLLAVAVLLIIGASPAVAAPAGHQQYIVKTKHVPAAKAGSSVQDVVRSAGGHVDYEWRDRLVVTLPDAAVQALVQHPAVDFVQKVGGIPDTGAATASSAEPIVTSASLRPSPKSFPQWTSGIYSYDGQGNITAIGSNAYSYDAFSRLVTSTTNGIPETYTYDRYGNLTQKVTGSGSTALTVQSPVDDGNHLSAHCYDKGGNLTDDDPIHCPTATETYSFDALNRMTMKWNHITHTKEYYIYNANDERIAVIPCSETACTEQITFSFRDESGKVLRQFEVPYQQFDSPWTWVEDYVYRDGILLAAERMPVQGGRRYFHTDHLGTPRLITDSSGRRISEHDYFPFGVEATPLRQDTLPVNGYNREEPMKFTGHERDFSVGTSFENSNYIDYMHARSTVPQWGRFLSVDPTLDIEGSMRLPQKWNRYSYVGNNPLKYTDPDGKDWLAAWLLGESYRNVSTWDAIFSRDTISDLNRGRQEWAEDHQAITHGWSPVPTTKAEVAMQVVMMGPIGEFIGTSFGKLGTVVANEVGKITGFSGHAIDQIITRGVSPALLKAVTSKPMAVLEQSAGRKLFLTKEGAVVLDKGGKVVTAYTAKEFDKKILDVLERATTFMQGR